MILIGWSVAAILHQSSNRTSSTNICRKPISAFQYDVGFNLVMGEYSWRSRSTINVRLDDVVIDFILCTFHFPCYKQEICYVIKAISYSVRLFSSVRTYDKLRVGYVYERSVTLCGMWNVFVLLLIKAKKLKGEISNVRSDDARAPSPFTEDDGSNNIITICRISYRIFNSFRTVKVDSALYIILCFIILCKL